MSNPIASVPTLNTASLNSDLSGPWNTGTTGGGPEFPCGSLPPTDKSFPRTIAAPDKPNVVDVRLKMKDGSFRFLRAISSNSRRHFRKNLKEAIKRRQDIDVEEVQSFQVRSKDGTWGKVIDFESQSSTKAPDNSSSLVETYASRRTASLFVGLAAVGGLVYAMSGQNGGPAWNQQEDHGR
jgi:hypothetical protein